MMTYKLEVLQKVIIMLICCTYIKKSFISTHPDQCISISWRRFHDNSFTLTSLLFKERASLLPSPDQQWVVIGETPKEEIAVIVLSQVSIPAGLQFADSGQSTRTWNRSYQLKFRTVGGGFKKFMSGPARWSGLNITKTWVFSYTIIRERNGIFSKIWLFKTLKRVWIEKFVRLT